MLAATAARVAAAIDDQPLTRAVGEIGLDYHYDLAPRDAQQSVFRHQIRLARERTIQRLELMYRPELSTLPERERQHLLIALEAITDIESWARMRGFSGLSIEEAREVWIKSIDRLLPPTPRRPAPKRAVS